MPGLGQEAVKRALDIALASVLIVIMTPLLLLLWCLVRSTSAGPAFFRQERLGRDMRPFTMLKLRSMYVGNDDRMHREYVTGMLSAEHDSPGTGRRAVQAGRRSAYHAARRVAAPDQPG